MQIDKVKWLKYQNFQCKMKYLAIKLTNYRL